MIGGSGKRFLRELTARWEASQLGKAEAQVRALEILIKKTINDTEEFLETKGKKITGSTREELMLSITVLLDSLRHDEEELANALGEIDSLLEEIARLEKNSEIKDRLIALFEKLVAEKDSVGAGLQQEIQELRQQLAEQAEEISRIRNRKKNGQAREKTLEEQRQDYQRRLEKIRKRQDELEKMLEEIDSGEDESQDLDGEACEEGTEPPEMEETGAEEQEGTKTEEVQNPGNAEMDSVDSEAGSTDPEESQTNPETSPDGADKAEGGTDSDTPESDECPEGSESGENREEELLDEIKKLKEELDEWKYRAQRNSSTSSIPPRMDGYNKGKPARPEGQEDDVTVCGQDEGEGDEEFWKEEEEAEKAALHDPDKSPNKKPLVGRRGKPPGSLGGGRTRPEYDETRLVKCVPSQCMSCPHRENCGALENARPVGRAFSVFDIKITRVITNYQPMECKCPNQEGQTLTGVYPKDVNNWFQFGNGIRALAVCLNTVGMVSYERISDILQSLIGDDKISGRVVNNWVSQTADRLTPLMKYLRAGVFDGPYMNNDETGIHVKGRLHWVHTACNMLFTYMRVDKQRGNGAQERIGVIPDYIGTMITDCWSSYWGKGKAHGLCIAHLLRELYALIKHFKKDREWAQEMMDLLMEMKEAREGLIS
ncbi:MAG: transposase, partial [Selenomonadaceae bacterium]|nr:transposase [Selenomonadaceae bacterium]